MAKFTFTGLDSIQYQLQARGAKVSGTVNHMLHAGAKIAREEMQAALKEYEIRDTGDLIKSIKASKIKKAIAESISRSARQAMTATAFRMR